MGNKIYMQTLDTLHMLQICGMAVSSVLAKWKQLLSQTNTIHEIHYDNIARGKFDVCSKQCAEYFCEVPCFHLYWHIFYSHETSGSHSGEYKENYILGSLNCATHSLSSLLFDPDDGSSTFL
jgi:hypothetical protein